MAKCPQCSKKVSKHELCRAGLSGPVCTECIITNGDVPVGYSFYVPGTSKVETHILSESKASTGQSDRDANDQFKMRTRFECFRSWQYEYRLFLLVSAIVLLGYAIQVLID